MAFATTSTSIVDRMVRAAKLDVQLYEEVEADVTATNQALLVVVLAAVASGIGAAISATLGGEPAALVGRLLGGILSGLIGWAVWSFVVYFVGTRFFGGTATYGELLRTLGFAYTPNLLLVLSFIPIVGGIVTLAAVVWTLVTSFIGIRQALDVDNAKTIFTIIMGVVMLIVVTLIISLILGIIFGAGVAAGSLLAPRP